MKGFLDHAQITAKSVKVEGTSMYLNKDIVYLLLEKPVLFISSLHSLKRVNHFSGISYFISIKIFA